MLDAQNQRGANFDGDNVVLLALNYVCFPNLLNLNIERHSLFPYDYLEDNMLDEAHKV